MNEVIVGDFETYYKPGTYSLGGARKLSTLNYITDPQFQAQSLATINLMTGERKFSWYSEVQAHVLSLGLENKTFVAHNNYFDGAILAWRYGVIPKQYACTQLMSMAVLGTSLKSHSLMNVAEHLGCPPKLKSMLDEFKGMRNIPGDPNDPTTPAGRMKIYNVQDTEVGAEVFLKLAALFPHSQYWQMDWAVRQFANATLRLDPELLKNTADDMEADDIHLYKSIGIPKSSFTSAIKFSDLLKSAGIEPPVKYSDKQKKMIPALSKTDLDFRLLEEHANPVIRKLCALRAHAASNIMLTRARSLHKNAESLHDNTWPMHVMYSGAMQTHRLSGADGAGGNPLNLPRGSMLRNAILPARAHKLYGADQNAFELRIARKFAGDERALRMILDPDACVYCDFASGVYGFEVIKGEHNQERQVGKTSQLALQYGTGHAKLTSTLRLEGVDMDEVRGKRIVDLFRYDRHKPVTDCWKYFDEQVIPRMMRGEKGYQLECAPFIHTDGKALVLPSGLKLQFHDMRYCMNGIEYLSHSRSRKSPYDRIWSSKMYQYCSQSMANEILSIQKRQIEQETGCRVVSECYDELVTQVPIQDDRAMAEIEDAIIRIMSTPPSFWPEIPLLAEGQYGDNYGEVH